MKQQRGKKNKQIRYYFYCVWARGLLKKEIGPENAHYGYPTYVLDYIRDIAPGDIVGELKEDAFHVTLETFCSALELPLITSL